MTAAAVTVAHETPTRLRLRLPRGADLMQARVQLEQLDGVRSVRLAPRARSITLAYDGRRATRRAILDLAAVPAPASTLTELPARRETTLPLEVSLLAAALAPLLPPPARTGVALALVAGKAFGAWRSGDDVAAAALDCVSLATTALTGHPLTATASVLMGAVAERRRNDILSETDRLLADLVPAPADGYAAERDGQERDAQVRAVAELQVGDRLTLERGAVVPADAIVLDGEGHAVCAAASFAAQRGTRLAAGTRLLNGRVGVRLERAPGVSRSARLHDHIRHLLRTRDTPGALTPDLQRLVALPMTAAGLVLALTGDAARTAAMLQADPQMGIALAQAVAREAAMYATARSGALLSGLESLDRLATATAFAFEDVGVLAEPYWRVDRIAQLAGGVDEAQVRRWLARLAGQQDDALLDAGLPDEQVSAWRVHGALLRDGARVLHIGGAVLLAQTWGLPIPEPDRRSLVRRLGIVEDGRLLATVHLGSRLYANVAAHLAQLRALGVRRIAVFTEDPTARPAQVLTQIGADLIVSRDRRAQEQWLDAAVQAGERVALVHAGLRDLLPPGGLSLCPVDAEAGAHGVLLGEPLPSLLAARRAAMTIRRRLRAQFGGSVSANAGLMVAAALRVLPPIATASIKHALSFLLLERSRRLAHVHGAGTAPPAADEGAPAPSPEQRQTETA